ncbi:MAG TPA: pyridoxal-phosphate dependent enzyme, partial [Burkholderiaceae bacterium]
RTTAQEILRDFAGEKIHAFVSGFGTGGTLLGTARGLKAADPTIRVIAAEPDNSPLLGSGLRQPRNAQGAVSASHPQFRPHLMQGWSPDFISSLTEKALAEGLVDEIVPVNGNDAMRLARELATREGIFVGTSSGATLAAALDVARRAPPGSHIVCMLPDTGERYLSTPLFDGIEVDMNEAELELSRSTPGYRFDAAPGAQPVPIRQPESAPVLDDEAATFVTEVVRAHGVVMFALEWCEFCWAARKLFAKLGIAYRSVDIDSAAFQPGDMGSKIRAVLKQRTGAPTIPQIYIGGTHVGGCTELFDAMRDGRLHKMLGAAGVAHDGGADIDPYSLLPKWLHPRKSA